MKPASFHPAESSPDVLNGTPVFAGTRVPVYALFENLEDGATVDEFLEWFPGVTRRQVDQVLEDATVKWKTAQG